MIATLITLLGGGLGGLLRFIPEILKLFTEGKDREHEYRMTQLQLDIDKQRATLNLDLVHAQGDVQANAQDMQAYIAAIEAQAKPSGVAWVDALSASVRPVVAYWWLTLFTVAKICLIVAAIQHFTTIEAFVSHIWTAEDAGFLSMILGFWYVDRSVRKNTGR